MRRFRRVAAGVLAAVVASVGFVALEESPAAARKVGNPGGGFAIRVHAGALTIRDEGFDFVDEGRAPQCSDGTNNDGAQDSAVDWPNDPQCSSATDDSETAGGHQPKLPIQLTGGTVNADGTFSFPTSGVSFPTQYLYVDAPSPLSDFIVTITITATSAVTGTINANTGAMTLNMNLRVDADGGPLDSNCRVEPIQISGATTGTMPPVGGNGAMTGLGYSTSTGRMTLVHNAFNVPGAAGCGSILFVNLNDQVNDQLGLPSGPGNNTASFLAEWTPTRPQPGIAASFTATPSSGPAPLTVNVNGSGSTGVGLTYSWDFDNNGVFDANGVTSSTTYTTPGVKTIRMRVTDADGDTAETTRTVSVGANQPPTASDQTVVVPEDAVDAPITLAGTDPEGLPLTFTRVAPNPAHGSVSCSGAACLYTPDPDFHGTDSFGFRVTDPQGNGDDGLITVNVTPVNDAPVASDVSATVLEDGSGPVTMVATDVEGTPLTYTVVDGPAHGSLSGTGATRTYTPDPDFNGTDTFTYRASDGESDSNLATATITVTSVNDAPTATDQSLTTPEDTPVPVTLSGTDPEGSPLIFSILDPPDHGTLSGSLPNLTYTPAPNYHGPDALVFRATDPQGASDTGTIALTVTPVNDAPTTSNLTVGTLEDTPVDVTIPGSDVDGDELTFTPTSPTANGGTVSCTGDLCTYTPASGFAGTDTFTVDVGDGTTSATATVTVNVNAVDNAPPVLADTTLLAVEDQVRLFTLPSSDPDGDPLDHVVLSDPAHGTLSCTPGGACTFTPNPDAFGSAGAQVQVSDGRGGVTIATVSLLVVGVNDAPAVPAQSVATDEDQPAELTLVGDDPDGDELTWTVKQAPTKGTLTCDAGGACTYTPAPNTSGADSFDVEASDGHGGRTRITVPVTIAAVDDPPTAGTVTRTVDEDGAPVALSLVGTDPDGGPLTFTAGPATSGDLTCDAAGSCTFTPAPDASGTETVAYTVSDGTSEATGAVVLVIVPSNDAPEAVDQTVTTPEDTPLAITLAAIDPDPGDTLTYEVTSAPSPGLLGGTAPALTYVPGPEASGTVSFGFRVTDAAGASSTGTITIEVAAVDDAPVAGNPSVVTPEDTPTAIGLTGSDAEGPVTIAVTTPPAHGTYVGGVYTPAADYSGPDSIGYTVTSGTGQEVAGTATITVTPVNDAPVAQDASVSTTRTVPVAITLGATDPDGPDGLSFAVISGPANGTLTGTAPNLTYTPHGLVTGSDAFTFRVTDPAGASDTATISITIGTGGAMATQLAAAPADVTRPTGLLGALLGKNTYTGLTATLTTSGGVPVSGQTVRFLVGSTQICTATTDAGGVATCSGKGPNVAATQYQASYAGTAAFAPSTATGSLS